MKPRSSALVLLLLLACKLFPQEISPTVQVFGGYQRYLFDHSEGSKFSHDFCYSYGLLLGKSFRIVKPVFTIRTGVYVDNKDFKEEFSFNQPHNVKSAETSILYGNIPLLMDYNFMTRKTYFTFASVGIVFGKVLNIENHWEFDLTIHEGYPPGSGNYYRFLHGGFGISYSLNNRLAIQFETFVKYILNINRVNYYEEDVRTALGARIGLKYALFPTPSSSKASETTGASSIDQ
jgi:hypothetical protein